MADRAVVIVDYGMGNLWSVASAVKHLGFAPIVSSDLESISTADTLILPGVGSFNRAMQTIRSSEIDKAIGEALHANEAKLLGICLGMQLLGKSSTEDGFSDGLGLVDNEVKKITSVSDQQVKIPNIGFREVQADEEMKIFGGLETGSRFYFVHSFCMQILDDGSKYAIAHHGQTFVAAIESGRVFGTQFHPEKSQKNGLKVLQNFLDL